MEQNITIQKGNVEELALQFLNVIMNKVEDQNKTLDGGFMSVVNNLGLIETHLKKLVELASKESV